MALATELEELKAIGEAAGLDEQGSGGLLGIPDLSPGRASKARLTYLGRLRQDVLKLREDNRRLRGAGIDTAPAVDPVASKVEPSPPPPPPVAKATEPKKARPSRDMARETSALREANRRLHDHVQRSRRALSIIAAAKARNNTPPTKGSSAGAAAAASKGARNAPDAGAGDKENTVNAASFQSPSAPSEKSRMTPSRIQARIEERRLLSASKSASKTKKKSIATTAELAFVWQDEEAEANNAVKGQSTPRKSARKALRSLASPGRMGGNPATPRSSKTRVVHTPRPVSATAI